MAGLIFADVEMAVVVCADVEMIGLVLAGVAVLTSWLESMEWLNYFSVGGLLSRPARRVGPSSSSLLITMTVFA